MSGESFIKTEQPDVLDLDAWISGAKRPERTVAVFGRGDLYAQIRVLEEQLQDAREAENNEADRRLTTGSESRRIAADIEAKRAEMKASRRTFTLRSITKDETQAALKGVDDKDAEAQTYALLAASSVEGVTAAQWQQIRERIGEGQFADVVRTCNEVSFEGQLSVPFSLAASAVLATPES